MTQCRVIGIEGPNGEPLNYILFSVYREDIKKLEEENEKLKEENNKLKDDFMRTLYRYYNMPATSNEISILVKEQYSKWYDDIKSEMRRQIMKEIGVKHYVL